MSMREKNYSYSFEKIGSHCDKMIQIFEQKGHYGERIEVGNVTRANAITKVVMWSVRSSVSTSIDGRHG
jgi:hypothetical protein